MAPRIAQRPPQCLRALLVRHARPVATSRPRPILPFLCVPKSSSPSRPSPSSSSSSSSSGPSSSGPQLVRRFTSERRRWWKHEARLVARYTLTLWGALVCVVVIVYFINEEVVERDFPTPHEWAYMTRKYLRDAHSLADPRSGEANWARALELARGVVIRLEESEIRGSDGSGSNSGGGKSAGKVIRLSDAVDPKLEVPTEFVACDISAAPEPWRRGYFEAIMLAAKAAEHVDGWLRDTSRNIVCPPEFVVGPSNPRPAPVPPGSPAAPAEKDCEPAYPSADNWYIKILATKGLAQRQRVEAALEYASFLEFKQNPSGAEALYNLALAEASSPSSSAAAPIPYDPKTLALRDRADLPSLNLLDALTAIATFKARSGDLPSALTIYLSLLKARRSLPDHPPAASASLSSTSRPKKPSVPLYKQALNFFAPPEYPPPPPDGTLPPWRDPLERCQEASLSLYIGEILYATGSLNDGLAWTRDAVDMSEEQLRSMKQSPPSSSSSSSSPSSSPASSSSSSPLRGDKASRQTCRECLTAGLDNWSTMIRRLAKQEELEKAKRETAGSKPTIFSFWSGLEETEGRWAAEEAVVQERLRRTRELTEDISAPAAGIVSLFKA